MAKILVVDDERAIARLICDALEDEGFETHICESGNEALTYILANAADLSLITLDTMLPDLSGIELCKMIRSKVDCPILIVTAKGRTIDTVEGLDSGADDYIAKPFIVEEFVARVKAHLRREERGTALVREGRIKVGAIEMRIDSFEVFKNGKLVPLSTREFQLLQYLMENAGKVLTREQIFNHVWNTEFGDIGTVAVNIKSVRDKIDPESEYIKTVWGVGYKFVNVR